MTEAAPEDKPAAEQGFRPLLIESIGGWRGMFDSGFGVVVFVAANALGGLQVGVIAAVAAALVLLAIRLVRKESVQQAVSGFFGVAIAAFIAWRMGQARGFFLLGIWRNLAFGALFLGSVLVRWPLVGVGWEYLEGHGNAWRQDRRMRRTYTAVTLLWAAVFLIRFLVQEFFYQRNATGWLAAASLILGYPLFVVALGLTILAVRRVRGRSEDAAVDPAPAD